MSEPTQRKPTIVVIATGGTIAMRIDPISGGPVPTLSGANLVAGIPALGDLGEIIVEEFANIPSEQMQPHTWLQLAQRIRVDLGGYRGRTPVHAAVTARHHHPARHRHHGRDRLLSGCDGADRRAGCADRRHARGVGPRPGWAAQYRGCGHCGRSRQVARAASWS
ncbi:MAG: asparaginase [Anaerolineae bacterium]|nr:asparaginase [Anaerolineae bacterium]